MTTTLSPPPAPAYPPPVTGATTVAELIERLGNIPADRIRIRPPLGTATEQDVLDISDHEGLLCELVDGILVEKPMGTPESAVAGAIIRVLGTFVHDRRL